MSLAQDLDVFYGRLTRSQVYVYARVNSLPGGGEWSISGTVRGPNAPGTRTLPTTVTMSDAGKGETLLAACAIPDPAFWTWQMPCTYDVELEVSRTGRVVETIKRPIGIRFFGADGPNLRWEAKRWVLRGVSSSMIDVEQVSEFADNVGAIITDNPTDALLERTSTLGILVAVELDDSDLQIRLRQLTRWPSVAIAILPHDCCVTTELRAAAPNVVFATRIHPNSTEQPDWAQIIICNSSDTELLHQLSSSATVPTIVERSLTGDYTLLEARRECDSLQRDLASIGDYAGYVVHNPSK